MVPVFSPSSAQGRRFLSRVARLPLKLFLKGMKLQPCNLTCLTARDAIIDADSVLTIGENLCELWKGFAKRGLGVSARQGSGTNARVQAFDLPKECQ